MLERLREGNLDRESLNSWGRAGLKRQRRFASTGYTKKKGEAAGENLVWVVRAISVVGVVGLCEKMRF